MTRITLSQLRTRNAMAWRMRTNPSGNPKAVDKEWAKNAKRMILCVAAFNYYISTFDIDLQEVGGYRHNWKQMCKRYMALAHDAHTGVYDGLCRVSDEHMGKVYNGALDAFVEGIERRWSIEGAERNYNILCSLSRLIAKYNERLTIYTKLDKVRLLYSFADTYKGLQITDHRLDLLVEDALLEIS